MYERRLEGIEQDPALSNLEVELIGLKAENDELRRRIQELEGISFVEKVEGVSPIRIDTDIRIDTSNDVLEKIRVLEEKAQLIQNERNKE